MKKETRQAFRDLGYYTHLGFSIALAIFIGLFIGLWIDKTFGTEPVFMFIFLVLGIIAGFNNIYLAVKRSKKEE
ncbi:MAG: AtpZ/AtpI family protein [Desulfobacteraceae bacterium]|nr:AtpZ/AtpI family protein [Desulfobacteraceae bacterium]